MLGPELYGMSLNGRLTTPGSTDNDNGRHHPPSARSTRDVAQVEINCRRLPGQRSWRSDAISLLSRQHSNQHDSPVPVYTQIYSACLRNILLTTCRYKTFSAQLPQAPPATPPTRQTPPQHGSFKSPARSMHWIMMRAISTFASSRD